MSDYTSHIDTEAIELDLMERYLNGSLTADEQREMEENLAEDPILADALEGLALIEDKEEMKLALGRIQEGSRRQINRYVKKRDQLSKRRSRVGHSDFKRTNYYVAAAAAVAVLICTVWVIDMSSNQKTSSAIAQSSDRSNNRSNDMSKEARLPRLDENKIVLAPSIVDTLVEEDALADINSQRLRSNKSAELLTKKPKSESVENLAISYEAKKEISSALTLADSIKDINSLEYATTASQAAKPSPSSPLASNDFNRQQNKAEADDKALEKAPASSVRKEAETIPLGKTRIAANSKLQQTDTAVELLSWAELEKIPLEEEVAEANSAYISKKSKKLEARETRKRYKYNENKPIDLPVRSEEDIAYGKIAKGQHMADLMVEAVELFEAGSNDESLVLIKEVLQTSPENPAANFYAGSIYRRYSQMKTATTYLKEATKYPESPLFEEARWELAQVYLARNKNGLAKKLLSKIASEGTKFAAEAREELKKFD